MKNVILTKDAPEPIGPYSQAIEVQAKSLVFCSGQISIVPQSGQVLLGSVVEQAEQVMKNVEAVLKASNVGFENVVKTTIFLTDMADFAAVNEIYGRYFKAQPPARSTVQVAGLPKGVKVEVEVIAYKN